MANQWFRMWHGFSSDPKWRTIARESKQPIHLVMAVYVTFLDSASQNVTRGHADVTLEDVASQLDVTEQEIKTIFDAMQGRVLDGFYLTGWEKRQPKREDTSTESGAMSDAERQRKHRQKLKSSDVTQCHAMSRDITLDKEEIREEKNNKYIVELFDFWKETLNHGKAKIDVKRTKAIQSALKLGYSIDDLKTAIVGCSKTKYNMGQNDRGEKYDSIDLIFRDADHIDRFIRNAGQSIGQQPANDSLSRYKVVGGMQ